MGKKYTNIKLALVVFGLALMTPLLTNAQIIINEIQYNPEGSDGGYEWIEFFNKSESPISLKDWTFRESDKNHRITQTEQELGWIIPGDGYAILADNPTKFLEKHPGYPGLLFDSSFTLVNTGENLELLNSNGELIFGFTYNPEWGGSGDGSTLGMLDGAWRETSVTPGRINKPFDKPTESSDVSSDQAEETSNETTDATSTIVHDIPATYIKLADPQYKEKTIKADGGADRTILSGVPFVFSGTGYGLAGGILDEPSYYWNFGDGIRKEGKKVLHTYRGPGTYTGTLKVTSGKYSHTDHFIVNVVPPELSVTGIFKDQTITIENKSSHTIEMSGFLIEHQDNTFVFPEESFISGSSRIVLDARSLGISISNSQYLYLRASNDHLIDSYHGAVKQIREQIALKQNNTKSEQEAVQEMPEQEPKKLNQVVYIGVPQNTQEPQEELVPTRASSTQTAQIGNIKKQLFSPFEMLLFACFVLITAVFGYIELKKYRKEQGASITLEEL